MGDGVGMNQLVHDDSEDVQMAVEALTEIRRETFVSRVSNIPLVNRSISNLNHAYQVTKNSSGIVKYSAESVENGVRTITGPILSTVGPALAPLDRLANSTLDKIQSNISYITGQKKDLLAPPQVPLSSSYQESFQNGHTMRLEEPSRYGWGKIVGGVGANLGMISDESMRGLRYCVDYIKHAIHNVEVQIGVLARSIGDVSQRAIQGSTSAISKGTMVVGGSLYSIVNNVKREIVETLRRVVDMLGKHSANYLPVDARATVKGFILNLPSRLANLTRKSSVSSIQSDDSTVAQEEAEKVLTLANESATMLRHVEEVFEQTIQGAESVLGKPELQMENLNLSSPSQASPME